MEHSKPNQGQSLAKDQTYRVNVATEPSTLDPGQTQYNYEFDVLMSVTEPLLKPKPDLSDVDAAAAEKWNISPDGLTWTFQLRKNNWSDGPQVKAQDFVYAWQRILDPRLQAPYADPFFTGTIAGAADYSKIDPKKDAAEVPAFLNGLGLSAADDSTFIVKLAHSAPYFKWVASLIMSGPIRKDVVDNIGADNFGKVVPESVKSLPTNGPFMYSEIVPKDHIAVELNPNWTGKKPVLTKIVFYEIADENASYTKYLNGELEEVDPPLAKTEAIRKDPQLGKQVHTLPNLLQFWNTFNTKRSPFDNLKVRQAFSMSVDRNKLANVVGQRRFRNSAVFIPKGMPGYNARLARIQKFDPSQARLLLQQSGVDVSGLKLLTKTGTADEEVSQFLKDQWKTNLGVDVDIEVADSATISQRLSASDYQVTVWGWQADYPDPQDWLDIWVCGSGNQFSGYCNQQFDELVNKADQDMNATNRHKLYNRAQKILLQDAPGGMLYQRLSFHLVKPYVQGVIATPLDGDIFGIFNLPNISLAQH